MQNVLKIPYTVCYDEKCMHNDHKRCKRGEENCNRRDRYNKGRGI